METILVRILALRSRATTEYMFKVLKSHHHHCHIIERLSVQTVFQHCFDSQTAILVHVDPTGLIRCSSSGYQYFFSLVQLCFGCFARQPNTFTDVLISHLIEYTITSQNDEVVLFGYLERVNVWLSSYDVWITSSKLKLGLWVTKRTANRKTSR